jgi:hypothetical protein
MRTVLIGLLVGACCGLAFAQGTGPAPVRRPDPPVIEERLAEPPGGRPEPAIQLSRAELQELLEAARETAKATREGVDYSRVVPDLLVQLLTKLDKIESKLDRIEGSRASGARKQPR